MPHTPPISSRAARLPASFSWSAVVLWLINPKSNQQSPRARPKPNSSLLSTPRRSPSIYARSFSNLDTLSSDRRLSSKTKLPLSLCSTPADPRHALVISTSSTALFRNEKQTKRLFSLTSLVLSTLQILSQSRSVQPFTIAMFVVLWVTMALPGHLRLPNPSSRRMHFCCSLRSTLTMGECVSAYFYILATVLLPTANGS